MPRQASGCWLADAGRDHRAPVAALGDVLAVAQAAHQLVQAVGDACSTPQPARSRLAREAVARQRRTDDVERVLGIAAVGDRVGQRPDHLLELDDRAGPAVGDEQRRRRRDGRLHVDEMDVETVDLRLELREAVELAARARASRISRPSTRRPPGRRRAGCPATSPSRSRPRASACGRGGPSGPAGRRRGSGSGRGRSSSWRASPGWVSGARAGPRTGGGRRIVGKEALRVKPRLGSRGPRRAKARRACVA
jgi:hypothetical protein